MGFSASLQQFDIFDIYGRFRDIKLGNACPGREDNMKFSREGLAELSKIIDSSWNIRLSILDELRNLMACLSKTGDFSEFSNFYDFVFFVCRENGQKNITVSRAIACWKLVLAGRFRLLNQWCDFIEKNQRYNISEDTWRQVLAFSRCVHEDLEGYDPEGAWPILIDDFVEHMYRITGSNDCSSHSLTCRCGDPEDESSIFEETLPGLKEMPGLKRKFREDLQGYGLSEYTSLSSGAVNSIAHCKRQRHQRQHTSSRARDNSLVNVSSEELQTIKLNSPLHSSKSACAVEGCLSKGFSGLFSSSRVQN